MGSSGGWEQLRSPPAAIQSGAAKVGVETAAEVELNSKFLVLPPMAKHPD